MCASVRPCLGHGIGLIMRTSDMASAPMYESQCKTMSGTCVTDARSGWRLSEILSQYPTIEGYK
ncbi:Glucoamylase [Gossypium arboreum]|uniref:Glucoamylase n=1 Tax=Gossypium arboreum TaxID=29729 RepID=A0A0B0N2H9_GOSAR|nr:Glucoamylase [Gossypium arboreum]